MFTNIYYTSSAKASLEIPAGKIAITEGFLQIKKYKKKLMWVKTFDASNDNKLG